MESPSLALYIRTVARLRNISAAAEELGVTQPALSARIKKLEEQLGAPVFDRSKSPLVITPVGTAYLECQDKIEALNRELVQQITALENMEAGHIIVGGASFFNITYLPETVARFAQAYPGIDVDIVDGTVPRLTADALDGKIDLFITPFDSKNSGLVYEKLLDERIFLCLPPQSPTVGQLPAAGEEGFAALSAKDMALLEGETFIQLGSSQQIGRKMSELFKLYKLSPSKVIHVDQTMTSLALTMAGVGISLVTETTLKNSNLKSLPAMYLADEEICTRSLFIARPKGPAAGVVSEFVKLLKETNGAACQ